MRRETSIAVAVLACALAGCAPRPLDSRDLASSLRATSSLAAETGIFIRYLRSGHATRLYASAHAAYLAEELDDERRSLADARVDAGLRPAFTFCREQQDRLGLELRRLETALRKPDELTGIEARIQTIGAAVSQARSGL